jgi:3-hydroxyisobutyrate dehydrogenase
VGFLGVNQIALPLAHRLLAQGMSVVVYNQPVALLEPLQEAGAKIALSPRSLIQNAEFVLLFQSNVGAIELDLLSGPMRLALTGRTVIQMSTIDPASSQAIARDVDDVGGEYFECQILGSAREAQEGKLILIIGSTPEQFKRWSEVLNLFGRPPLWVGSVGTASALKLALSQMIATLTATFGLSLSFVERYNLDPEKFLMVLRNTAVYARSFDKLSQRMRDRNFSHPYVTINELSEETEVFLQSAQAVGLNTSGLEGIQHLLEITQTLSLGDADYSSLLAAIAIPPKP